MIYYFRVPGTSSDSIYTYMCIYSTVSTYVEAKDLNPPVAMNALVCDTTGSVITFYGVHPLFNLGKHLCFNKVSELCRVNKWEI